MSKHRRSSTVRELILRAHERDSDATTELLDLVQDDLVRVIYKNISNSALAREVLQDVYVRIFYYLPRFRQEFVHRATTPDPNGDRECLEKLRRWTTNLARNWVRTVNYYGPEAAAQWSIPGSGSRGAGRRDGIFHFISLDGMRYYDEEGEPGEDPLDIAPVQAAAAGRRVV